MLRSITPFILAAALLPASCGGDEGGSTGAERSPEPDSAGSRRSGVGIDAHQFASVQLRSARAALERRFGRPAATSRPNAATECLDYPGLDESGARVAGLVYRFCFNAQGELAVRTTVGNVAP